MRDDLIRVTGDVTNSGLETANAVEITSLAPAEPVFPYKLYAVGALKPDDFSSFEVTFRVEGNTSGVPLQTSFKDRDGNIFTSETSVEINHEETLIEQEKPSALPENLVFVIPGAVLVFVIIAIWYSRRRKA